MRIQCTIMAVAASLLLCPALAPASPINLIVNGEFESPTITGDWLAVSRDLVPGWTSSETNIEFWRQGFSAGTSFGINGSDGLPGGQNVELGWNNPCTLSQTVTVPALAGPDGRPGLNPQDRTAVFSFDWAERDASTDVHWAVRRNSTGLDIVSGADDAKRSWARVTSPAFEIVPGETLTVRIWNTGGGGNGSHLDQVEMWVDVVSIPEPATLALLLPLATLLRRRTR